MTTANKITEEIIEKVRTENPGVDLHHLGNEHGEAIFRSPSKDVYDRYLTEMLETETRLQAFNTLVRGSCVYPDKDGLTALLKEKPGLLSFFANELTEIAGVKRATVNRKL